MTRLFGDEVRDLKDLQGKTVCVVGSATAGYAADANGLATQLASPSSKLSSQTVSSVLAALGAKTVTLDQTRSPASWQSKCLDSSNLFEFTPILVDAVDLSRKSFSITSSGFRSLVYVVVMREKDWDALTSRVQLGLTAEITKSAGEVTADATNRETSALTSLFKKGFVSVNTTEMDKSVPEGAWRAAFGDKQPEVTNLILWVSWPSLDKYRLQKKRLVPEKHGDIRIQ